jgi:hypothetical protein
MLRFMCPCGKKLKVAESMVGKVVECPQCHTKLEVPAADGATEAPAETPAGGAPVDEGLNDLFNAVKGGPAVKSSGGARQAGGGARGAASGGARPAAPGGRPSAMSAASRRPGAQAPNSSKVAIIGVAAAVGLMVAVGLIMWAVSDKSDPTPPPALVQKEAPVKFVKTDTKSTPTQGMLFPTVKGQDPTGTTAAPTAAKAPAASATATPAAKN